MLSLLLAIGLLLIGTVLLIIGADWFLDGAGDLGHDLGVSALVLGVLLAGLEAEEMLTAAIASACGAPTLAVGNVIGTNVTIVTAASGPLRTHLSNGHRSDRATASYDRDPGVHSPRGPAFSGSGHPTGGDFPAGCLYRLHHFLVSDDRETVKRHATSLKQTTMMMTMMTTRKSIHVLAFIGNRSGQTFGGLAAMAVGGPAIVERALRFAQVIGLSQGAGWGNHCLPGNRSRNDCFGGKCGS